MAGGGAAGGLVAEGLTWAGGFGWRGWWLREGGGRGLVKGEFGRHVHSTCIRKVIWEG